MQPDDAYAVVIVSFNHAETLDACLAAVLRLQPLPARIIVIDNASTDASASIAKARGVEVIRQDQNIGFAAAVNRGLEMTTEPWFLLLNPDCAPAPVFVAELMLALVDRPEQDQVGALTGLLMRAEDTTLLPGKIVDAAGMVVTASGRHFDRGAGVEFTEDLGGAAWVFGATGAATLYRRSALDDVAFDDSQVFAETFFAYREDAELAWRLQLRGWRCLYVGSALAAHRRGFQPERGRGGHEVINYHSVKNRFLLRWHCADISWHLRCFPMWLIRDILVVAACLTIERSSLPALKALWGLRFDASRRRQWVLSRRTVDSQQIGRWFRKRWRVQEISRS